MSTARNHSFLAHSDGDCGLIRIRLGIEIISIEDFYFILSGWARRRILSPVVTIAIAIAIDGCWRRRRVVVVVVAVTASRILRGHGYGYDIIIVYWGGEAVPLTLSWSVGGCSPTSYADGACLALADTRSVVGHGHCHCHGQMDLKYQISQSQSFGKWYNYNS